MIAGVNTGAVLVTVLGFMMTRLAVVVPGVPVKTTLLAVIVIWVS
jgi:hypothetical protein